MINNVTTRVTIRGMQLEGHREADTGMIYLGVTLSRPGHNLVFRVDDTDFLINVLSHSHRFKGRVILDMGLTGKNNRRRIDVKQLAGTLSPLVSTNKNKYTIVKLFPDNLIV